jgi:MFS family permease
LSDIAVELDEKRLTEPGFYYGWVNLAVAALAMIATLPGRTQGLGLITEPMLNDLHLGRLQYATMNGWATLIGSAFALACGPLIDRLGVRVVLTAVVAALSAAVLAMARVTTPHGLLLPLVLTRGFGQSALSVVSLTIVGKWFVRRLPVAMGVYSILISMGFVIAFVVVGKGAMHFGWRPVWSWIGWFLVAVALIGWIFVRRSPESIGVAVDGGDDENDVTTPHSPLPAQFTLPQALRTSAFWAFALSGAIFALVSTGLMLFNEAVLTERGYPRETMVPVLGVITFTGLFANFLGGWLAERWPIGRLMGAGMFFLAASLVMLPLARGRPMVYAYAVAIGIAGGVVMVVFFVCWGKVFGRRHLGSIQGAAQILTVLGSAAGPIALQMSVKYTHTSATLLFGLAPVVVLLGAWCMLVPAPQTPPSGLT